MNLEVGRWVRPVAIAAASVFITSVASIGQVQHEMDARDAADVAAAGGTTTTTFGVDGGTGSPATTIAGAATTLPGAPTGSGPGRTTATAAPLPMLSEDEIPQFGLRTQGVTDTEVKVGMSYNVAACGDAGTLSAMLGAGVTGDPKKAIDAFTRHVNDTGGIGGRTMKVVVVDDGGSGCPEKSSAAAVKLADEEKVFLAIPGLHVVADYLIANKVPTFGGRDDPASLAAAGPNGIMLTEAIEPTLEKWTAFGKHYLDSSNHKPCLIHPESGVSGDWNSHEKIIVAKFEKYGMKFTDIITYQDDVSTAQQQANTISARAKSKGCDQVYFMAVNPIALIFFTQAATQNLWFPTWTFTSYMALADTELAGRLMDQRQWENAIGLSTRVPAGEHKMEGNCKEIYDKYYAGDGQNESASVQIVCAQLLSVAEIMRRAVARTGILTSDSLLVGADAVRNDFFFDATVPLRWSFPEGGPYKTKGFSHFTVVDWSSEQSKYLFPEYPMYWEVMGEGKAGGQDLRQYFQ
ncbi:MAG TPA: ABC transporter substrate-binding protein [Acidimicrobiales bacterium]|nr:ABC transporter substrate-binding protein [Acidimicrobiales bacterium]